MKVAEMPEEDGMRKLKVNTFMTLDGVMQAPGGSDEDTAEGFSYGGWIVPFWNDETGAVMDGFMGTPFDLVLGRKTYEIFASYWPHQEGDIAKPLNDATKYVATRRGTELSWDTSVALEGEAHEAIAKLKKTDGPELQVHGSANLLQTLIRHNLVDEFHVWTFPLMLGAGKRLFADGTIPQALKVIDSRVFSNGVVRAVYAPDGEVQTGSFD